MPQTIIPFARLRLLPEGDHVGTDDQPVISPNQIIWHTAIDGPGTTTLYNYWMGVNLESHGYVTKDGSLEQYMHLDRRADANYLANRRPDGTGALSFETWDGRAPDSPANPWTPAQLDMVIATTRWLCDEWSIPKRLAPAWDRSGIGYHNLYPEWSPGATSCPGTPRRDQLVNIVIPAVQADAQPSTPKKDNKMISVTKTLDGRLVEFRANPQTGEIEHRWQESPGAGPWVGWRGLGIAKPGAFDNVVAETNVDGRLELFAWHSAFGAVFSTYQQANGGLWVPWYRFD